MLHRLSPRSPRKDPPSYSSKRDQFPRLNPLTLNENLLPLHGGERLRGRLLSSLHVNNLQRPDLRRSPSPFPARGLQTVPPPARLVFNVSNDTSQAGAPDAQPVIASPVAAPLILFAPAAQPPAGHHQPVVTKQPRTSPQQVVAPIDQPPAAQLQPIAADAPAVQPPAGQQLNIID